MSEATFGARSLLCRVRGRLCALPLALVVETMRPLPLVPFAGAPPFVRGIAVIRGVPTPVVDPGELLGWRVESAPSRFVTVQAAARRVALAFDEVVGVRDLSATPTVELPPLLGEVSPEALSAIGALDAELLVVLRSSSWVPESLWQDIGRAEPSA